MTGEDGEPEQVEVDDLLVLRRFGDPIYPTLTPIDPVERGNVQPRSATPPRSMT